MLADPDYAFMHACRRDTFYSYLKSLNNEEILELANNLREGVTIATPVFDGAKESEVKKCTIEDLDEDLEYSSN